MSDKAKTPSYASRWVLGIVVALVLYVLGSGPVTVWEWSEGKPGTGLLGLVDFAYTPVSFLAKHSERCWLWHARYCRWCAEQMGVETPGSHTYD